MGATAMAEGGGGEGERVGGREGKREGEREGKREGVTEEDGVSDGVTEGGVEREGVRMKSLAPDPPSKTALIVYVYVERER